MDTLVTSPAGTTSAPSSTPTSMMTTGPTPTSTVTTTTGPTPTSMMTTSPPFNTMAPVDWSNYTPNPGAIDATGLMDVLSKYLVNSPLIHDNAGDFNHVDDQIDTINAQLNSISNTLSNNNTSTNVLSQQDNVKTILDTEMNRLNTKQQGVDSAMSTQKRMLMMNDSYIKRQKIYTRIMIVISIGLVVLIVCRVLSSYNEDDENTNVLLSMVSILVIVFIIIYCCWAFVMLWRRDPIYFDQLKFIPDNLPAKIVQDNSLGVGQEISAVATSRFTNDNYCIGSSCCSAASGTVWDDATNSCKKQEGFVDTVGPNRNIQGCHLRFPTATLRAALPNTNSQPFDADEYANYALLK